MCGLTGYLSFNGTPASFEVLEQMSSTISHRGPDGKGVFVDGPLGLAHRRLSILDLSELGHQPMATEDGRFVISYNGEIYNHPELRSELSSKGWQFVSRTDTEVVLKAFAEWGTKCFERFNGMFALAVWDNKNKELTLARDRYGVKPLYLYSNQNCLIFGSEIKAILSHPNSLTQMNIPALAEYMTFQNFLRQNTLFSGVEILEPGTWTSFSSDNRILSDRFWDFEFSDPKKKLAVHEYEEELDFLFQRAVKRQLVGDVDIGSYLSGGMDSGSVTAIAAKNLNELRTFTVGFDLTSASGLELGFDERETAEYMSYKFKTEHYEMVLKAGDMERCMEKLVWHMEEPRVGQSYPNFYAAKLASKFDKVVLSGTGGDELFAGYPWRYYRAAVNNNFDDYIEKYYSFWQRLIPSGLFKEVFRPIERQVDETTPKQIFRDVFVNNPVIDSPQDYINNSLYFEAKTFLHSLLVVEDKLSMAHSLETRVPFLDNDLVDFALKVPVNYKLGNLGEVARLNENQPGKKSRKYFEKTKDGKLILRRVMERYINPSVTSAVKKGFSAPDESWFRGESLEYVQDILCSGNPKIFDYLDKQCCQKLVDEHLSGKVNRRLYIWSLLYLENFLRLFPVRG